MSLKGEGGARLRLPLVFGWDGKKRIGGGGDDTRKTRILQFCTVADCMTKMELVA